MVYRDVIRHWLNQTTPGSTDILDKVVISLSAQKFNILQSDLLIYIPNFRAFFYAQNAIKGCIVCNIKERSSVGKIMELTLFTQYR